jgi:ATPase subunit of ABC transporter with duplicated ATPase domains
VSDITHLAGTDIVHIENRVLQYYRCTFDQFQVMAEQKFRQVEKAYDMQQKQIRALKVRACVMGVWVATV